MVFEDPELALARIRSCWPGRQAGLDSIPLWSAALLHQQPVDGRQNLEPQGGFESVDDIYRSLKGFLVCQRHQAQELVQAVPVPRLEANQIRWLRVGDALVAVQETSVEGIQQVAKAV